MLVLSRRPNEDILFPNSGIRVRLLRVKGNHVRVGIEAPPGVPVLRAEIAPEAVLAPQPASGAPDRHALRNQLNKVTLGLYHFQQLQQAGLVAEANATFERVLAVLDGLDRDWLSLTSPQPARPAAGRRHGCRALLVEDDANERELLAGLLAMNGCECATAADGQDALDYLASHDLPDLVLLDMGLPRVSGREILERIRREPGSRGLKVFAVSGTSQTDLGITTGPDGVDVWFTKPLNPRRLWEAIQQGVVPPSGVN